MEINGRKLSHTEEIKAYYSAKKNAERALKERQQLEAQNKTSEDSYYEAKFDEGKEQMLMPVKMLELILAEDKGNPYIKTLLENSSSPYQIIVDIEEVLQYGAKKYSPNSWQKVPNGRTRYASAFYRHLKKTFNKEDCDEESGLPHVKHLKTNLMFMAWFYELDKESPPYFFREEGE